MKRRDAIGMIARTLRRRCRLRLLPFNVNGFSFISLYLSAWTMRLHREAVRLFRAVIADGYRCTGITGRSIRFAIADGESG